MNLKYNNIDDFIISQDENITESRLNKTLFKFLENDKGISPLIGFEPRIWECRWYNDDTIPGYEKGYAVWINTEDPKLFIQNKADNIYQYAIRNNYLVQKVEEYDSRSRDSYEMYYNMLTGYTDSDMTFTLQPMYYIGSLDEQAQIRVSLVDNNKNDPSDSTTWKNYFIRTDEEAQDFMREYKDYLFEQHIQDYHIGLMDDTVLPEEYAENTLYNVEGKQIFTDHIISSDMKGFDFYTDFNYTNSSSTTFNVNQISDEYTTITTDIYTLKNPTLSGYYQLSSYLLSADAIRVLSGCANYGSSYVQNVISKNITDDAGVCHIEYRLSNTTSQDYPFVVPYTSQNYNRIKSYIGKYECSYKIKPISAYAQDLDDTEDYEYIELNKLSTTNIDDISEKTELYQLSTVSEYIKSDVDEQITHYINHKWVRVWNSGYIEQGGTIELPDGISSDMNLFVKFDVEYGYQETTYSYYNVYEKLTDDISYDMTSNIDQDDRYVVDITPIADSYDFNINVEINTMRNDGFYILVNSKSPKHFAYSVSGFKKME